MTIDDMRKEINGFDHQILIATARRFAVCKRIAEAKQQIEDPERERALQKLWKEEAAELGLSEPFALALLALLLQESKLIQKHQ